MNCGPPANHRPSGLSGNRAKVKLSVMKLSASRKLALAAGSALMLACSGSPALVHAEVPAETANSWMARTFIAEQAAAGSDTAKEAVANRRAKMLIAAMTVPQKMQQLTGSPPEILPELPQCFGARHVRGVASLSIPTFRITNGPVGVGQNDCVAKSLYDEASKSVNPTPTRTRVPRRQPRCPRQWAWQLPSTQKSQRHSAMSLPPR